MVTASLSKRSIKNDLYLQSVHFLLFLKFKQAHVSTTIFAQVFISGVGGPTISPAMQIFGVALTVKTNKFVKK